jgi:uncharacterized protein YecE (DUF72 family)
MNKLYISMGGWELPSFNKLFYPPKIKKGFRKLEFYSKYFDSVEVNTSFYNAQVAPHVAKNWLKDVSGNKEFVFTVKLYRGFTHTFDTTDADVRTVHEFLDVFAGEDKLGGVLMQFPYSFSYTPERWKYLTDLGKLFNEYTLFVEIRHGSWNKREIYEEFKDNNLHPVNVDLPRIRHHIQLNALAWGEAAYFRMMGRNASVWYKKKPSVERGLRAKTVERGLRAKTVERGLRAKTVERGLRPLSETGHRPVSTEEKPVSTEEKPRILETATGKWTLTSERYNYMYTEGELQRLLSLIEMVQKQTEKTFVVFHNDPDANSLINGFQLRLMTEKKRKIEVPPVLAETFPELVEKGI